MTVVSVPDEVREAMRNELWSQADALGWADLSALDKTRHYERWTRDPNIGGVLGDYMDPPRVRVYLKDAIFKPYSRAQLADWGRLARALGVETEPCSESFIKPHGRRLPDGRLVCWGPATAWKDVLMALHERAFLHAGGSAFAGVFLRAIGRYREDRTRAMVEDAAIKLQVSRIIWLES
jgi:hypothetical protein